MSRPQNTNEKLNPALDTQPRAEAPPDLRAGNGHLKSRVIKRSLVVGGHKTSISLEDAFWIELRDIAAKLGVHLSQLAGSIDVERQHCNLSSAIRLFVFEYCTRNGVDELSQTSQAVLVRAKRYASSPH